MTMLPRPSVPRPRSPTVFRPVAPEHAQAIGYLVTEWALIDEMLAAIIMALIRLRYEPGHAITAELSSMQRFNLITTLMFATREQGWVDEWEAIAPTFDNLRSRRNDIVHSSWQVVDPSQWALRITAKTKVIIRHGEIKTEEIRILTKEIIKLFEKLQDFLHYVANPAGLELGRHLTKPPLSRAQGRKARDHAQARAAKRAKKEADQHRDQKPKN